MNIRPAIDGAAPAPGSAAHVSVFSQHFTVAEQDVAIAVVLPTFKRPEQLVDTLTSLAEQTINTTFAVIVVENHADFLVGRVDTKLLILKKG